MVLILKKLLQFVFGYRAQTKRVMQLIACILIFDMGIFEYVESKFGIKNWKTINKCDNAFEPAVLFNVCQTQNKN